VKPNSTGFEWVWNDPDHLDAHRKDFLEDPSEILAAIYEQVAGLQPEERKVQAAYDAGEELWLHRDIQFPDPVGWTGLRDVCLDKGKSFWGFRTGRSIPSHLCLGEKEKTSWLCLWGRWEPRRFVIHTIYPGRVAPREIHDPSLPPEEIQRSIDFWRCHAIVVGDGEYSLSPHA
jgi:hypothetical protein